MDIIIRGAGSILPVFIALLIGVLCRKKHILKPEGVAALRSVAVNITLPAVMLNAFATAEYTKSSFIVPPVMFGVCCAALVLGLLLSRLLRIKGRLTPYLFTGFEAGMLGYALFALLYGDEGLSSFAIVDLGQVLFVFTVYKALLSGKGNAKALLKEALTSPTLYAIIAGILINVTGLYGLFERAGAAEILNSCTSFISAPTGMLILLSIGYELSFKGVGARTLISAAAVRIAVMGALYLCVLTLDKYVLGGIISADALLMMFILPPPYVLPVFAVQDDERAQVSSLLSAMTLISLLMFAGLCMVNAGR